MKVRPDFVRITDVTSSTYIVDPYVPYDDLELADLDATLQTSQDRIICAICRREIRTYGGDWTVEWWLATRQQEYICGVCKPHAETIVWQ